MRMSTAALLRQSAIRSLHHGSFHCNWCLLLWNRPRDQVTIGLDYDPATRVSSTSSAAERGSGRMVRAHNAKSGRISTTLISPAGFTRVSFKVSGSTGVTRAGRRSFERPTGEWRQSGPHRPWAMCEVAIEGEVQTARGERDRLGRVGIASTIYRRGRTAHNAQEPILFHCQCIVTLLVGRAVPDGR